MPSCRVARWRAAAVPDAVGRLLAVSGARKRWQRSANAAHALPPGGVLSPGPRDRTPTQAVVSTVCGILIDRVETCYEMQHDSPPPRPRRSPNRERFPFEFRDLRFGIGFPQCAMANGFPFRFPRTARRAGSRYSAVSQRSSSDHFTARRLKPRTCSDSTDSSHGHAMSRQTSNLETSRGFSRFSAPIRLDKTSLISNSVSTPEPSTGRHSG